MLSCPICGSEAEPLPRTGDSVGFDCVRHGKFKVAGTVVAIDPNGQWENAYAKAKARAEVDELPLIMTYDFE